MKWDKGRPLGRPKEFRQSKRKKQYFCSLLITYILIHLTVLVMWSGCIIGIDVGAIITWHVILSIFCAFRCYCYRIHDFFYGISSSTLFSHGYHQIEDSMWNYCSKFLLFRFHSFHPVSPSPPFILIIINLHLFISHRKLPDALFINIFFSVLSVIIRSRAILFFHFVHKNFWIESKELLKTFARLEFFGKHCRLGLYWADPLD